ncbi:MAG: hypothetical protein KDA92_27415, partial [Planctomycetales bacterium]|nr:hypothetical protein [Planctomycetales bacterium]
PRVGITASVIPRPVIFATFGCRTHFCAAAGGPANRKDVRDLIHRLEEIDHRLGGNGGVSLPVAVREAMG